MPLFELIDAVNDSCFWQGTLPLSDRRKIARQIAATHGKPGSYADTFSLDESERKQGIRLFTGEITKSAAARHIAGEEACRALLLLDVDDSIAKNALATASANLLKNLYRSEHESPDHRMGSNPGAFCCGRCSVAVWRHVTAGGLDRAEERLAGGIKILKKHRSNRRWAIFPFWYTLSALAEMSIPQVKAEIKYVAPLLERAAKKRASDNIYEDRRCEIARRCLQKI